MFLSCWNELDKFVKHDLELNLEKAFDSDTIPTKVLHVLLNMSEFMEHVGRGFSISTAKLGLIAENADLFALALHFQEIEFKKNPNNKKVLSSLININNKIQQPESAYGILKYAIETYNVEIKESWFEEIKRWEDALNFYNNKLKLLNKNNNQSDDNQITNENGNNDQIINNHNNDGSSDGSNIGENWFDIKLGKMRCLRALGEWDKLELLSQETWKVSTLKQKIQMAEFAAKCAWHKKKWNLMEKYVSVMEEHDIEGCFLNAILSIHQKKYKKAFLFTEKTRKLLSESTSSLLNESYNRAYHDFVGYQQLYEIEEVIHYLNTRKLSRKKMFRRSWRKRLLGAEQNMTVWWDILSIYSIALPPKENYFIWLKFSKIVRKFGNHQLSRKFIIDLLKDTQNHQKLNLKKFKFYKEINNQNKTNSQNFNKDPDFNINFLTSNPKVIYEYLKSLWRMGQKDLALKGFKYVLELIPRGVYLKKYKNNNQFNNSIISSNSDSNLENDNYNYYYYKNSNSNLNSDSGSDSNSNSNSNSNSDSDSDSYSDSDSDFDFDSDSSYDSNPNPNPNSNSGPNSDSEYNSDSNSNPNPKSHLGSFSDPSLNSDSDLNSVSNSDSNSNSGFEKIKNLNKKSFILKSKPDNNLFEKVKNSDQKRKKRSTKNNPILRGDDLKIKIIGKKQFNKIQRQTSRFTNNKYWNSRLQSKFYRKYGEYKYLHNLTSNKNPNSSPRKNLNPNLINNNKINNDKINNNKINNEKINNEKINNEMINNGKINNGKINNEKTNNGKINNESTNLNTRANRKIKFKAKSSSKIITKKLKNNLILFYKATLYDPAWYKVWHSWAKMNLKIVSKFEENSQIQNKDREYYLASSIKGFFKSISLSPSGIKIQDTLRLLTIWFRYGSSEIITKIIESQLDTVSIDTWLLVIPQLIARVHSQNGLVRTLLHRLLNTIGKKHPQALIFPLTVAYMSQLHQRQLKQQKSQICLNCKGNGCKRCRIIKSKEEKEAESIKEKMRTHSPILVEQAEMVSKELIRVAILWNETWHQAFEDTSRMYFRKKQYDSMLKILQPLHKNLKTKIKTRNEQNFIKNYGQDLNDAWGYCEKYFKNKNKKHLDQAWKFYYIVFKKIAQELPKIHLLKLKQVSDLLDNAENLQLAIPGSYRSTNNKIIRILKFHPTLRIISSKQRPRKLKLLGTDGKTYQYLLKGHEDLRQDERVMQLFGLVNTLLSNNAETSKRNLNIERYAVVPLSPNSGLLGWVPNSDTIHDLIQEYRKARRIIANIEYQNLIKIAPDYEKLLPIQKLEVFNQALKKTDSQDLAQILWLKSSKSESWLDRRTNYIRSLAVMSMVGYILGLGDRHPSNLMMNRSTGKIVHIDFGDCFEVAINRSRFPETIPFRLTRMVVNAMEISGTHGIFRYTCRNVMKVLRDNKESLMTMLEAFIYDPLVNWKLQQNIDNKINDNNDNNDNNNQNKKKQKLRNKKKNSSKISQIDSTNNLMKLDYQYYIRVNANNQINSKAIEVMKRISDKLTGKDFINNFKLIIPQQVDKLIQQATSNENLCQCYLGWCPFW
ncbi:serine/threonine-protein kinase mtor [Anaeramoeba flamelloides]|uniref:non-specific serine/threonine protein kinase n=1 Tax=Anaeramoeba flamelloides TaxID=1746091 RepID=A0AAV7YH77_9EUKA|nr:serine/threonine-protein kinase mtor [Anaeramoeba flamelloides]